MIIHSLKVVDLFNAFEYEINFSKSDVLFITGPNGYGKTTILDIINSIYSNDLDFFRKLPFKEIYAEFDNGSGININKIHDEIKVVAYDDIGMVTHQNFFRESEVEEGITKQIYFVYDGNEKIELKQNNNKNQVNNVLASGLTGGFFTVENVFYIKAQRLHQSNKNEQRIVELANDLSEKILEAALEAGVISQSLDSSFPNRLFSNLTEFDSYTSSMNTGDRLIGLENIKKNYARYGLIERDYEFELPKHLSNAITNKNKGILDLYISDALKKLTPYEDLFKKIDLFVGLVSSKSLAFKKIAIDREKGFYFHTKSGTEIPLGKLSSGEQNQIIIYYDLIFNTNEFSIVLLDEPEISLHVTWQKELWDSIGKIKKLNGIPKILIATHSPQIINQNWDLECDLFNLSLIN